MKKLNKVLIFISALTLILTGCESHSQSFDLAICGSYGVPGMFCNELKGGTFDCEVLETDSQGRILFSYTTQSVITGEDETAIVICQSIDSKNVYFYEDQCYFLDKPTDIDIELLKEQNDWGHALDYSKMAKRSNMISFDLWIVTDDELKHNDVKEACSVELGVQESQIKELSIIDKDLSGNELRWLVVDIGDSTNEYYALINTDYEVFCMEGSEEPAAPADIARFKQENGWDYGNNE